ncbi:hypothetical protein NBRC116188_00750 [Oceaniserpentilla sp. 4NH20-0058]|uniref:general secretion pathway protein GspB n=1 Tax=Oceaniserpentilla sp. 4NH20-0058 TaxID=3127660 RepID=UPI00310385C4
MSYLLKALAKAEQERQQQKQGDQLSTQVLMVESKLPKSLLVVVFLLVAATIWQLIPKSEPTFEEPSLTQTEPHPISKHQVSSNPVLNDDSNKPLDKPIQPEAVKAKDLYELSTEELARIPSLELASHIYSSAPSFRSVVINGQTYEEGMLIKSGVILDEIIPSGIVINVQGQKVELPKGISWIASQNVK